ncbi:MAG TPA: tetratricopeptide repeat protein [Oscillatoriaceae cyanobacterium M33_DOE_052]|uniref:Tetratricopeptide repeat protein n=1 Tax=Planktothricoides sp. SpSt-374 TaxID=2282167 RepID=A0A7C3ZR00_9CYAN|nr:tetratricopeptide repeat protein [Oscillatoriaceae cyanobacterium M33_DOE_052]
MIGQILARRYQIRQYLGSGSFGTTYLAVDMRRPGNPICVVKQLRAVRDTAQSLKAAHRRFIREAQILEKLGRHDHIPQLLAYFQGEREFYLVEEYIPGAPLSTELVPGAPKSESETIQMVEEVLEILAFVHSQNAIHRDVKPANLIRRTADKKLVLIDFGSVKELDPETAPEQKLRTIATGTPAYMPLEQFQGNPRFNSDIYALGMMAIQALTGCSVPQLRDIKGSKNKLETGIRGDQGTGSKGDQGTGGRGDGGTGSKGDQGTSGPGDRLPVSPSPHLPLSQSPHLPRGGYPSPELVAILEKMVAEDYTQRYQSAAEVLADLAKLKLMQNAVANSLPATIVQSVAGEKTQSGEEEALSTEDDIFDVFPPSQKRSWKYFGDSGWIVASFAVVLGIVGSIALFQAHTQSKAKEFYNRAVERSQRGEPKAALADLNLAIQLVPNYASAYYSRGRVRFETGDYGGAIGDYTRAIELNPNDAGAYANRCLARLQLASRAVEQFSLAVNDCTRAIELNPNYADAYASRCLARLHLAEQNHAISDCTRAIHLNPNHAIAYYRRGLAAAAANDLKQALADYTSAIRLNPQDASAYNRRGMIRSELGDQPGAISDFEKSAQICRSTNVTSCFADPAAP